MGRKPNSKKHLYTNNSQSCSSSSENYENSSNDSSIKTCPGFCDQQNNNSNYNFNNINNMDYNNDSYETEYKNINSMNELPENITNSLSLYRNDKNNDESQSIDRIQSEYDNSITSIINEIIKFTNRSEFQSTDASKIFSIENLQALLQISNLLMNRYHNSL